MLKKLLVTGVLFLALAAPASAFHCPADMAKIDAALPTAKLSAADKAKVQSLRAEGERLHGAGDHAGSVDVLGKAMAILGIN